MKKIKFSHNYCKFGIKIPKTAILREAFRVKKDTLHKDFINWDTAYWGSESRIVEHYSLDFKDAIILLFNDENGKVWTTIRRWTPRKEEYYRNARGEEFEVIVDGKSP